MDIRIGKSARNCCACNKAFVHEEPMTSLVRIQDGALAREDYCEACWAPQSGQAAFSVWTLTYYDAEVAEQEPPEAFSPLRQLFYEAVESSDRIELSKAYLAAQLLRRQKVFRLLKEADGEEENVRIALFSDRIGNKLIEVRDPNLTSSEMEEGRTALITRLQELEEPADTEDGQEDDDNKEELETKTA